jgi:3-hydroxybutyryl-CoA dehydrogenase
MIRNISIIGAGTMGHGIANVFATAGYSIALYEPTEAVLTAAKEKIQSELQYLSAEGIVAAEEIASILERITLYTDLAQAVKQADYVIEATPEILELKKSLFIQLDKLCPAQTILASNTSSLPLKDMIEALPDSRKAKTMVCHWYNPAHLIPIAELSYFGNMSDADYQLVEAVYIKAGKRPVKVLKDVPGLIANRMLHALAREVFYLMETGVGSPEDIDAALKYGPGFRSATTGILEVADMGGLDIWCLAEDNLFKSLNNSDHASEMLRQHVKDGNLGLKTGKGFYTYDEAQKEKIVKAFQKRLVTQLKVSKTYS